MAKKVKNKDTRLVKPRIGHVQALRTHRVERDRTKYHRPSSRRLEV